MKVIVEKISDGSFILRKEWRFLFLKLKRKYKVPTVILVDTGFTREIIVRRMEYPSFPTYDMAHSFSLTHKYKGITYRKAAVFSEPYFFISPKQIGTCFISMDYIYDAMAPDKRGVPAYRYWGGTEEEIKKCIDKKEIQYD